MAEDTLSGPFDFALKSNAGIGLSRRSAQGDKWEKAIAKNDMFPRGGFVKDPSTSLRISLGGSDAARTAQDVLLRD
jgi:hypothetical protein